MTGLKWQRAHKPKLNPFPLKEAISTSNNTNLMKEASFRTQIMKRYLISSTTLPQSFISPPHEHVSKTRSYPWSYFGKCSRGELAEATRRERAFACSTPPYHNFHFKFNNSHHSFLHTNNSTIQQLNDPSLSFLDID